MILFQSPINNSKCPSYLAEDIIEYDFMLDEEKAKNVWKMLQRRETFVRGQVPPYQVNFETGLEEGEFFSGEKNIHHGPFLSVHGEIGEVKDDYRSLFYYYGSYVISFRLVRPWLLEFFKTPDGISMKLYSYVHPLFKPFWRIGNYVFWKFFRITFRF